VAAGFKVRRIKSEVSIGDRLKRTRIRKKITVADVEEATKIRAKFILALESDSWEQIPSEVYGRGYLERYSEFLQMDDDVMKQYDRERHSYARNCVDAKVEFAPKARRLFPRFQLTSRVVMMSVLAIGILGFGTVVMQEVFKFTAAPSLEVFAAEAKETGTSDLIISGTTFTLNGKTAIGASVKVNDLTVPVDQQGNFSGAVSVQPGVVNAVVVKATLPNGKETSQTLSVRVSK